MASYTVGSLFSGCGGKDLGFAEAGFSISWANDCERAACETYTKNIGSHIVCGDIREIPSSNIPDTDIVIGGFPCQGFSIVGTRRLNDDRNFLYKELKRVVKDKQPAFFVAENVRGLLNLAGGKVISAMAEEFRRLGYRVDYKLLNARDFGTPQHRERVFIIGNRLDVANRFPSPTHGPTGRGDTQQLSFAFTDEPQEGPYRTLRDAIGDLETLGGLPNHEVITDWIERRPHFAKIMKHLKPGQKLCNVRLGPRSVYTWNIPEVFGRTTRKERQVLEAIAGNRRKKIYGKKDGNPLPLAVIASLVPSVDMEPIVASLVKKDYLVQVEECFELKNAFNGIFRRLRWDEPSEAVLTVFASPRYYVHPSQDRSFSVRECARIQDFPDDFVFCGALKEQYTQVGNAVPRLLARAVAQEVIEALHEAGHVRKKGPKATSVHGQREAACDHGGHGHRDKLARSSGTRARRT